MSIEQKGKRYHHGDLRRVLAEAALNLATEEGSWDFSLRDVARRAGVSHAAPYRHYGSKRELMAEIAAQGFEALRNSLEAAAETGQESPSGQLARTGAAYVRFGLGQPALYRLMFGPSLVTDRPARLHEAASSAFGVLRRVMLSCWTGDSGDAAGIEQQALLAWAQVHGITMLALDGWLEKGGVNAEILMERASGVLLSGFCESPSPGTTHD